MKKPKIIRPEIDVEFVGVAGFFDALRKICKFGIRKCEVNQHINISRHVKNIKRTHFWIMPKYYFKSVKEITNESEETT